MNKVIIIAEAGVNHNGELAKALELIKVAAESGADIVKFQTFRAETLVSAEAVKAEYQQNNLKEKDDSQFAMLKKLELNEDWYIQLIAYAQERGIMFSSTGFDEASVDFLENLGQSFFKIPSGEITNKPLLEHIGRKGKNVILSTGMSSLEEISAAIKVLMNVGMNKHQLTVLHCNTQYPTPMKDVNLLAMLQIKEEFGVNVGYSDHTLGIEVPIAAVALGAVVIEKHFTLDRNLPGPDHAASLEPKELKDMVKAIRNIELAISGSGIKEMSPSEEKNKVVARKSVFVQSNLQAGHILSNSDLVMKRPGDGISPMRIDELIGKEILTDLTEGTKLKWEHIK